MVLRFVTDEYFVISPLEGARSCQWNLSVTVISQQIETLRGFGSNIFLIFRPGITPSIGLRRSGSTFGRGWMFQKLDHWQRESHLRLLFLGRRTRRRRSDAATPQATYIGEQRRTQAKRLAEKTGSGCGEVNESETLGCDQPDPCQQRQQLLWAHSGCCAAAQLFTSLPGRCRRNVAQVSVEGSTSQSYLVKCLT